MSENTALSSLTSYSLLGRSGLRVSPLCLGTMTFGTDWGWGADAEVSRKIFYRYLEAGGNFIDTANGYTNGHSEEMLGEFMTAVGNREQIVLATKFSMSSCPGDPNASGNGRKNIHQALDASLRRLKTDYIDLYWMHVWDGITPVEEVMDTLDGLVKAGKIRYIGLSDVPAWYLTRAQTLAELQGRSKVVAAQLEYSLVERNIEREHIPAASELGIGVCPWGPLSAGFLTGKFKRDNENNIQGKGRFSEDKLFSQSEKKSTEKNWMILNLLMDIAKQIGKTPSQVALNWATKRPGISSTIIGASKLSQLDDNLQSLEFDIPEELSAKLEEAGRPETVFPYNLFEPEWRRHTLAVELTKEPKWYRSK